MSAIPSRYEPTQRLIDNRQELARLYVEKDLTICEIADEHAEHEKTRVYNALCEYGIIEKSGTEEATKNNHSSDDVDPPSDTTTSNVDWSQAQ